MSFELFGVEFNGKENPYPNHKLMDEVFIRVGKKFMKEWLKFGVDEGVVSEVSDINQVYKWFRSYEDSSYPTSGSKDSESICEIKENGKI